MWGVGCVNIQEGKKIQMALRKNISTYVVLGILVMMAASTWGYVWYIQEQGNFHVITSGEAYRSAQLDEDELRHYIQTYGIRSIINLRGKRPDKAWYQEEIAVSRELGILHFDYGGIKAIRPPSEQEVGGLLALFTSVPRPVLLHCQAGSDRSGLAAAIWKGAVDRAPISEARKQLSIRYGHMPVGPTHVLDEFFDFWASTNGPVAAANSNPAIKEN